MTEVLHSPPHFASSPTRTTTSASSSPFSSFSCNAIFRAPSNQPHLPLLAFLVTLFRRSFLAFKSGCDTKDNLCNMDIGSPTNVRHVAHVTFDRFNGFLGLPVEFEPEVPRRPPSASATVFGVSTESMQLSYDSRGNSVPTILLLMQRHLYAQGGLQVEGIFRINPDNSQEEHVRNQLNLGLIPEGIDVHCLAGLIKAWFRELPTGVLDSLSQEQVMQCQTEEECVELARHLPHTEAALLDWAINLMADVAQHEHLNKMNARNIAMVFAPNMTQMADPFTALMYAVQVMNFLKLLILRTLRERKDSVVESYPRLYLEPYDENGHHTLLESSQQDTAAENEEAQDEENVVSEENSVLECSAESVQNNSSTEGESGSLISSSENPICDGDLYCEFPPKGFVLEKSVLECSAESLQNNSSTGGESGSLISSSENPVCKGDLYCEYPPKGNMGKSKSGQSSSSNARKGPKKKQHVIHTMPVEKKGTRTMSARDTRSERIEAAWR